MNIMTSLYVVAAFAIVPLIIFGFYARLKVHRLFEKYSNKPIKKGITGSRFARTMLNSAGLDDIVIEEVGGSLKDHYDPRQRTVRLSRTVARSSSVAAIGIAAHEAAHAIQDGTGYPPIKVRNGIAPIVSTTPFRKWRR